MFREVMQARAKQLPCKIGDLVDALGCSYQAWGDFKSRPSLGFSTMQKIALVLAIDVDVLASRSVERVCAQPVPSWDWLRAYKAEGKTSMDWSDFQRRYQSAYPVKSDD